MVVKKLVVPFLSLLLLVGCGQSQNPNEFPEEAYLSHINVTDYVKVCDYRNINLDIETPVITDIDVEERISTLLASNGTRVVDRAAKKGDVVDITFHAMNYYTGEDIAELSKSNYIMRLGAGILLEGFDENIIGMNAGATTSFETIVALNGEEVRVNFSIVLNQIIKSPVLSDGFVTLLQIDGVETVDQLREHIAQQMYEVKMYNFQTKYVEEMFNAIYEQSEKIKLPEQLLERTKRTFVENAEKRAEEYSTELGANITKERVVEYELGDAGYEGDYEKILSDYSEKYTYRLLLYKAIADQENITVSDNIISAEVLLQLPQNGFGSEEEYKKATGVDIREYVKEMKMYEKVEEFLLNLNVPEGVELVGMSNEDDHLDYPEEVFTIAILLDCDNESASIIHELVLGTVGEEIAGYDMYDYDNMIVNMNDQTQYFIEVDENAVVECIRKDSVDGEIIYDSHSHENGTHQH